MWAASGLPAAPAGSAARDLNLCELRHDAMRITRINRPPLISIENLCESGHVFIGATIGVIVPNTIWETGTSRVSAAIAIGFEVCAVS